jgi:hypothetical protein
MAAVIVAVVAVQNTDHAIAAQIKSQNMTVKQGGRSTQITKTIYRAVKASVSTGRWPPLLSIFICLSPLSIRNGVAVRRLL